MLPYPGCFTEFPYSAFTAKIPAKHILSFLMLIKLFGMEGASAAWHEIQAFLDIFVWRKELQFYCLNPCLCAIQTQHLGIWQATWQWWWEDIRHAPQHTAAFTDPPYIFHRTMTDQPLFTSSRSLHACSLFSSASYSVQLGGSLGCWSWPWRSFPFWTHLSFYILWL